MGNPAGFLVDAWERGLSGRAALQEFRDAGGAMRDSYFRDLYAQVGDTLARAGDAAALPLDEIPAANQYATWSMGAGGEYATDVTVMFRDQDTGLIGTKNYTYVTADPHTPGEAHMAAADDYGDPDVADSYDQEFMGTVTKNVYATVAWSP